LEELKSRSISGKRSWSAKDPRPPLDQQKLQRLENVVREKCAVGHREFVDKFQNVQKVLRRPAKISENP
jgi:hypothetical protein